MLIYDIVFFVSVVCILIYFLLNPRVRLFMLFKMMFAVFFFVSIPWNWLNLFKIAEAEHQHNLWKMEKFHEKCTGHREIGWVDTFKEWFRTTFTLQDDPCEEYYKVINHNPFNKVTPVTVLTYSITTFITDPLKHFGQGISEFLRALLKDLPVTLWIPVLIMVTIIILVIVKGSVQAVVQHVQALCWNAPALEQQQHFPLMPDGHGEDAPAPPPALAVEV